MFAEPFNTLLFLIYPPAIGAVIGLLFWHFLFRYFFKAQSYHGVFRDSVSGIQTTNNSVITLSTGAILVTFTVLQIWERSGFICRELLLFSWFGFAVSVFLGITINVSVCMKYAFDYLADKQSSGIANEVQKLKKLLKKEKVVKRYRHLRRLLEFANLFTGSLEQSIKLRKVVLGLLFVQPFVFFVSLLYLLLFISLNFSLF